MNIWLIRHGMTLAGEEGRYQGFLDQSLSENGRAMLAEAPHKPSHIYVSPAKRARETASILFPDAEQICVPGLWEMNFGVFEGRTWKEMENLFLESLLTPKSVDFSNLTEKILNRSTCRDYNVLIINSRYGPKTVRKMQVTA